MVGFANGDGTFCPGGSYSNMLGLNLARYRKFPDVKEVGLSALPNMVAFCSKHCHYSNKKNAALLGLGTNNMVGVNVNEVGEMDIDDLKRKVQKALDEGSVPFCVIGTSGTTVMGAYDNLNALADVCQEHNMWLHTDACWGGGALFSKKLRSRCAGIERSDSVAMNPHKLLSAPQQCCMFVTQHPEVLSGSSSLHVPYLFQNDKTHYNAQKYDIGRKVIQCGRRVDAVKLWMMWKAQGNSGLEARVNKSFANARYLADLVKKHPGMHLFQEPTCTNVCFFYVPERLRDQKFDLSNEEFCREINAIPPKIKRELVDRGSMMTGYQPIDDKPNFFRMIVISEDVTFEDMEFVVNEIDSIGRNL
jgi:glutamate/tyrosine decarboxylase-like PLP-dependent enzyme